MIQLMPYDRRSNRDEIIVAYLRLLHQGLLFSAPDLRLVATQKFGVAEDVAHAIFSDRETNDPEQEIKAASADLHSFLYAGTEGTGHVNIDRLYDLLTVPMIEEVWERKRMTFVNAKVDQSVLKNIFGYHRITSRSQMYAFTEQLKTEVCPYCNRIFTATIHKGDGGRGVLRPQIDHFKDKIRYPYFAMSILNWVPSCGFCNQTKASKEEPILYPYAEGAGNNFYFYTCYSNTGGSGNYVVGDTGTEESFLICSAIDRSLPDKAAYAERIKYIEAAGQPLSEAEQHVQDEAYLARLNGSRKLFCWEEASQHHKTYVLRIFQQNHQFGKEYSASLGRTFRNLFTDPALIYLRDIRQEHWGDSPLAKLTHDIDLEIQKLQ